MDAMISARVPAEIKKQGDFLLKEMGSSVTELVNSAYAYLLENKSLPKSSPAKRESEPSTKTLSGADAQEFENMWKSRIVFSGQSYDGGNFDELLDQARSDYYARFA